MMEAAGVVNRLFAGDPAARRRNLYLRWVAWEGWDGLLWGSVAGCAAAAVMGPGCWVQRAVGQGGGDRHAGATEPAQLPAYTPPTADLLSSFPAV